jgi:very-short-patch-repair endonuclease
MIPRVDKADLFAAYWRTLAPQGAPQPQREYRFAKSRRWRFDFAWPSEQGGGVAVEIDGGSRMVRKDRRGRPVAVGRHTLDGDLWKLDAAASLGWLVLRYSPQMLRTDPARVIEQVIDTMGVAGIMDVN